MSITKKVRELETGDQIPYGTVLGLVQNVETLTVKGSVPVANGRYAITFYRVGSIFLHGEHLIPVRETREGSPEDTSPNLSYIVPFADDDDDA